MATAIDPVMEFLYQHNIVPPSGPAGRRLCDRLRGQLGQSDLNPRQLLAELIKIEIQRDLAQASCAKAKEAAEQLQMLLESLVKSNADAYRLERVIEEPSGVRAVCRQGERVRELSVHPEVSAEQLRRLQPWEFVRVHENVVVGVLADDPQLFENSLGEVVTFQGYGESTTLARISRLGNAEELVRLAPNLCESEITPRSKLVLMRDNPRWAIARLPAQEAKSRFEVPIASIDTRLSDLAGIEALAEKLLLEIVKRVISPEIRQEFNLDPLRGLLLCSERPGMGKTAFMRAIAGTLHDIGQQRGFDVVLYLVKPNEFKSMWHGEDARIVREELFGAIHARRNLPREQGLLQLVVLDEIDSLGRRPEARDTVVSGAQSDALEALLVEMDGMVQQHETDPPAHLLVVGMTNRPERIDDAIKRPGRLGDEVIEIPDLDQQGAEQVCLVYARGQQLPWYVDGQIVRGLSPDEVLQRFLRPAVAAVFSAVVARYASDTQKKFDVTGGQVLSAAHYRKAMNVAKNRAANRRLRGVGLPGIATDDVLEGLLETAVSVAEQMQADPHMLIRHLKIKSPVARVEAVPREQLEIHRFVHTTP